MFQINGRIWAFSIRNWMSKSETSGITCSFYFLFLLHSISGFDSLSDYNRLSLIHFASHFDSSLSWIWIWNLIHTVKSKITGVLIINSKRTRHVIDASGFVPLLALYLPFTLLKICWNPTSGVNQGRRWIWKMFWPKLQYDQISDLMRNHKWTKITSWSIKYISNQQAHIIFIPYVHKLFRYFMIRKISNLYENTNNINEKPLQYSYIFVRLELYMMQIRDLRNHMFSNFPTTMEIKSWNTPNYSIFWEIEGKIRNLFWFCISF
jgi:hypothetical protein